jgi:hypothetical protein
MELLHDKNDKPKRCGIVEFECTDSAKKSCGENA